MKVRNTGRRSLLFRFRVPTTLIILIAGICSATQTWSEVPEAGSEASVWDEAIPVLCGDFAVQEHVHPHYGGTRIESGYKAAYIEQDFELPQIGTWLIYFAYAGDEQLVEGGYLERNGYTNSYELTVNGIVIGSQIYFYYKDSGDRGQWEVHEFTTTTKTITIGIWNMTSGPSEWDLTGTCLEVRLIPAPVGAYYVSLTPVEVSQAENSFQIHIYPCEPMDVSVGDSAEVYVDVDGSYIFEDDEKYQAIVSSTDADTHATDIVIKVWVGQDLIDNDPGVAIYSINGIDISYADDRGEAIIDAIEDLILNTSTQSAGSGN